MKACLQWINSSVPEKINFYKCIFIVTRKDGTLLNVTSVSEENIIEICVMLGHTHPLGVLSYLATELAALFHTTEEMQWASHTARKAMELQDEPIAMQTITPSEHHIRVYIATVWGDPSKPWSPPSEGEVGSHSPTSNPHLGGGTPHHLQAELGNFTDQELCPLMEDLIGRLHFMSCTHTPAILNQHLGENHRGAVILVGMTRRSPFQEGEGGFPQDNHLHFWSQCDQIEDGFLKDHLLKPQGLLQQIQMWGAKSAHWHWSYTWVLQK